MELHQQDEVYEVEERGSEDWFPNKIHGSYTGMKGKTSSPCH